VVVELPTGTVTFLFTDLEVSTRLWEHEPDRMRGALARHDAILREAVATHGGHVVKGTGDGIHAVFATADSAVHAAVDAQLALVGEAWELSEPLRVRMGVHTGVAELRDGDYFGPAVNRAARLMSLAHGGQIVVSLATEELARDGLAGGVALEALGEHQLRDVARPEVVFQVRHPRLGVVFPPLRSLERIPGKLPVRLTSFVGRERELAWVLDALERAHVVTLIGVGGVGKTRLALQAAAAVSLRYGDGVWFCELAPVRDRAAVPEAVAACLQVREQPGESLLSSLVAFLRAKRVLLVLDNCEHVIEEVGSLAETITHACAEVQVLATSREALAIDGELLGPVGSLPVPGERASAEDLAAAPSVRLFADRAAAVRPDFVLDAVSAPVVADICRQLDGVPLAIELAAARVASLTVVEIARRLDQRFRLLTGGRRTALERHQTLRAAVDWSYELLAHDEARMFNRLAVFAGGFTLAAAEAVVGGDGIADADVLELLSGLVARSMLAAEEVEGVTRYRLHETMRQYARERLDALGEQDVVRARHARYFVTLAEAVAVGVTGRDEQHWVHTADVELANLRAALDWSVATGDADLAMRESVALGRFGLARLTYKVWHWLDLAAAMPQARHHPLRPYVMALALLPYLVLSGDLAAAAERLRAAEAAFDDAGIAPWSPVLFARAGMASVSGRTADARTHGIAAIERSLASGERHLAGTQGAMLALLLASGGDIDAAITQAERALAVARELENPSLFAISQCALGYALSTVDPERAIPHLEAAISLSAEVANDMAHDIAERCLARVRARRGDLATAAKLYRNCLDRATDLGGALPIALTCESLAVDLTDTSHYDVAATIFGALETPADAYRGNPMVPRAAAAERLQQLISDTNYERYAALGRAMDTDALATYTRSALDRIIAEHTPVTPDR
jgi:predicted ATPase/class 3 adenylate cyclase